MSAFLWQISCPRLRFDHIFSSVHVTSSEEALFFSSCLPHSCTCRVFPLTPTWRWLIIWRQFSYFKSTGINCSYVLNRHRWMFRSLWPGLGHLSTILKHPLAAMSAPSGLVLRIFSSITHGTRRSDMTGKLSNYLLPVPACATDPLAGWCADSPSSAVTMRARELCVCCLHLPPSQISQEHQQGRVCVQGKMKKREKCSLNHVGLGKKKKSSVQEMRQRRLWRFSPPPRRAAAVWGFHCEAEKCCWRQVCFPGLRAAAHEDTRAHKQGNMLPSLEAWDSATAWFKARYLPLISRWKVCEVPHLKAFWNLRLRSAFCPLNGSKSQIDNWS